MNKLESILSKYPHYYDKYYTGEDEQKSNIWGLTKAFADELELILADIDRVNAMVGIDTTYGQDLYFRWGALLNLPRQNNETDDQYRARLKNSINVLSGGTAVAIQYAIAVGLGINHDQALMDKRITIYDAWEYNGSEIDPSDKAPAHIVCYIDLESSYYDTDMEAIVIKCIEESKAAGIKYHYLVHNFRILVYEQLDDITYEQLANITYNDLG